MFILYAQDFGYDYVDEPKKIAIFSTEDDAKKYIEDVTLVIYPNGSRRFRRDSLLGCYGKAWVEKELKEDLPVNPQAPDYEPAGEWIVEIQDPSGRTFKINHGRYYEEAVKDMEREKKMGNIAELKWRPI